MTVEAGGTPGAAGDRRGGSGSAGAPVAPGARLAAVAAGLLAATACATAEFHEHYEAGRFAEAVEAFRADSALADRERALFRAGVARLLAAGGPEGDREAAALFRRLLERHPGTRHRPQVRLILDRIERRAELRRELDRARRQAEVLRGRVAWMRGRLSEARGRGDSLSSRLSGLVERLRAQERDCAQLQQELERLKRIDLEPEPEP